MLKTGASKFISGCLSFALAFELAGCLPAVQTPGELPTPWGAPAPVALPLSDNEMDTLLRERFAQAERDGDAHGLTLADAGFGVLGAEGHPEVLDTDLRFLRGVLRERLALAEKNGNRAAAEDEKWNKINWELEQRRKALLLEIKSYQDFSHAAFVRLTLLDEERALLDQKARRGGGAEVEAQIQAADKKRDDWAARLRTAQAFLNDAKPKLEDLDRRLSPEEEGALRRRAERLEAEEARRLARSDMALYGWILQRREKVLREQNALVEMPTEPAPEGSEPEGDAAPEEGWMSEPRPKAKVRPVPEPAPAVKVVLPPPPAPAPAPPPVKVEAVAAPEGPAAAEQARSARVQALLGPKPPVPPPVPEALAPPAVPEKAVTSPLPPPRLAEVEPAPAPPAAAVQAVPRAAPPAARPVARRLPPPAPSATRYRVEPGDTLPSVAKKSYGDQNRWREIYQANESAILKGLLQPGQWLLIPKVR